MRTYVRVLMTGVATTVIGSTAAVSGITGSSVAGSATSPSPAPTTAAMMAGPTAAPDYALPGGLTLPHGTTAMGKPTTGTGERGIRRWEVRLDLGGATGAEALDLLAAQLGRAQWHVDRGPHDLFAARQANGRWEIVVARWPAPLTTSAHTIGIGIGSRTS